MERSLAVLEVLLVFAATHVLLKTFKQFSTLGALERSARLNLSPGLFLGGIAVLAILIPRRDFNAHGLGAVSVRLRSPSSRSIAVGFILYLCPLLALIYFDPKPSHAFLSYCGFLSAVSFGEEIFFRGYMQSRLNDVFGRPWLIRGIPFGFGLIVTSLVFGFLHALNTVDYFHGRYSFDWGWASITVVTGLLFGLIREATDSVWPSVAVHGLLDVWVTALLALSSAI
ncbi:MAG: CPBP family intramembrane glutamic endopeptidase [Verrucomicrobiota bacterium]